MAGLSFGASFIAQLPAVHAGELHVQPLIRQIAVATQNQRPVPRKVCLCDLHVTLDDLTGVTPHVCLTRFDKASNIVSRLLSLWTTGLRCFGMTKRRCCTSRGSML